MKWTITLLITLILTETAFTQSISQKGKPFSYSHTLTNGSDTIRSTKIEISVNILIGSATGASIYAELHKTNTDSFGIYQFNIGEGIPVSGQFDSIIWSEGIFYLRTKVARPGDNADTITRQVLMRVPPELSNDYEQGTIMANNHPEWGEWNFVNTRNKRPRLITIDLTTSYANLAYPANTYPIYRHYEWCDPDRDGYGNSFVVSYSENTNNHFIEHSNKLGDVQLYAKPFQELTVNSTNSRIDVLITKPESVPYHSETYAIKGPWKFIPIRF
jgi:hypothetical protein